MATPHEITATIDVTDEHIRSGARGQCSACPIALAIRSAVPYASETRATPGVLVLYVGEVRRANRYEARTPIELLRLISEFDGNYEVEPVSATVTFRRVG